MTHCDQFLCSLHYRNSPRWLWAGPAWEVNYLVQKNYTPLKTRWVGVEGEGGGVGWGEGRWRWMGDKGEKGKEKGEINWGTHIGLHPLPFLPLLPLPSLTHRGPISWKRPTNFKRVQTVSRRVFVLRKRQRRLVWTWWTHCKETGRPSREWEEGWGEVGVEEIERRMGWGRFERGWGWVEEGGRERWKEGGE